MCWTGAATLDSLVWPRASVLAERLWSPASRFGTDAQGKPDWHGAGPAAGYKTRLIMWMCQMLRRGVRPTPPDDRDHFPRRSLWEQCELDLPPPHPTGARRVGLKADDGTCELRDRRNCFRQDLPDGKVGPVSGPDACCAACAARANCSAFSFDRFHGDFCYLK